MMYRSTLAVAAVLAVVVVCLKVTGHTSMPWFLVLMPFWAPVAVVAIGLAIEFAARGVKWMKP